MNRWAQLKRVFRAGRLLILIGMGGLGALLLPPDVLDRASQELMALFGLMMAAVLPTMVLAATVLRPGGLSVKRIASYRDALIRQVQLWAGLFLIALASSLLVVVGKMVEWEIIVSVAPPVGGSSWTFNLACVLNGCLITATGLLFARIKALYDGIVSLITLSAEIAQGEARMRDELAQTAALEALRSMKLPPDFGARVELPH